MVNCVIEISVHIRNDQISLVEIFTSVSRWATKNDIDDIEGRFEQLLHYNKHNN